MTLKVSIIIPSRTDDPHLRGLVESLKKQIEIELEIIIVYNPKLPEQTPREVRLFTSNEGANYARNVGLKNASHDLIYFLDSDCELDSSTSLRDRVQLMTTNNTWVAAGGPYQIKPPANKTTRAYNSIQNRWLQSHLLAPDQKTPFLLGGNMMLRRSLLHGLEFDENMKFGATEKEFFCRLKDINTNIYYLSDWPVFHVTKLSVSQLIFKARAQAQGNQYIEKKGVQYRPQKTKTSIIAPDGKLKSRIHFFDSEFNHVLLDSPKSYLRSIWLRWQFQIEDQLDHWFRRS